MEKEDLKVIRNVIIIVVLAMPCCLLFTDSWFLRFLGIIYSVEYWNNIGKAVYKRYWDYLTKIR